MAAFSGVDNKLAVELMANRLGKWYLGTLQKDYDEAVKMLLYVEPDQVEVCRGKARALYEQIQKFERAISNG